MVEQVRKMRSLPSRQAMEEWEAKGRRVTLPIAQQQKIIVDDLIVGWSAFWVRKNTAHDTAQMIRMPTPTTKSVPQRISAYLWLRRGQSLSRGEGLPEQAVY